jgi:hypothetical protein
MIPMAPVFNGPGLLLHDSYEGPRRGPRWHPTGPLGNLGPTSETLAIGIGDRAWPLVLGREEERGAGLRSR